MPRQPRVELAGGIHHVVGKATARRVLFHSDRDRQLYLRLVAREVRERRWRVLTFCLMTNHAHLLVLTPEPDLGLGFKRIHEEFAQSINREQSLEGHLFGARFYSDLVRTDKHLLGCFRYIARNPVRHGACRQPRDWPWSAHRALAGLEEAPQFLDVASAYGYLGADRDDARTSYLRLVAQSDEALMTALSVDGPNRWLTSAADAYSIPVPAIATFLGVSRATAYRRLAAARETEGTVPSVSVENEGTDLGATSAQR